MSFLTKGKQVYVEGRLQQRSYDDKEGVKRYVTEVIIDDLILLGGGSDRAPGAPANASPASRPGQGSAPARGGRVASDDPNGISDSDVPF